MKLHEVDKWRKQWLRKKQLECSNCGALSYEEDLRTVSSGDIEPPYGVCPECGSHELTDCDPDED